MINRTFIVRMLLFSGLVAILSQSAPEEIVEFQDINVRNINTLRKHNSPMPESGDWWIRINGELVKNKRKTVYLWKGNPRKRSAISGRVDGEGVWKWKQRPAGQGYAPFDLEMDDVIHIICRNGDEISRCYKIIDVRTNAAGEVRYFKGRQVPCD